MLPLFRRDALRCLLTAHGYLKRPGAAEPVAGEAAEPAK